jgi:hypothetical protein
MENRRPLSGCVIDGDVTFFYAVVEEGTLTFVDDGGTRHVEWDSGSTLGIVLGVELDGGQGCRVDALATRVGRCGSPMSPELANCTPARSIWAEASCVSRSFCPAAPRVRVDAEPDEPFDPIASEHPIDGSALADLI